MNNAVHEVISEMDAQGGRFVQRLAAAMTAADPDNLATIIQSFPTIMERYDHMATLRKQNKLVRVPAGKEKA